MQPLYWKVQLLGAVSNQRNIELYDICSYIHSYVCSIQLVIICVTNRECPIHLEKHCNEKVYQVTTTVSIDYKLMYTKFKTGLLQFPSCKSTNYMLALRMYISNEDGWITIYLPCTVLQTKLSTLVDLSIHHYTYVSCCQMLEHLCKVILLILTLLYMMITLFDQVLSYIEYN